VRNQLREQPLSLQYFVRASKTSVLMLKLIGRVKTFAAVAIIAFFAQ